MFKFWRENLLNLCKLGSLCRIGNIKHASLGTAAQICLWYLLQCLPSQLQAAELAPSQMQSESQVGLAKISYAIVSDANGTRKMSGHLNHLVKRWNNLHLASLDVGLSLEDAALTKVEPIDNQNANDCAKRSPSDGWHDVFEKIAHGVYLALCGAIGAILAVWLMTPNDQS